MRYSEASALAALAALVTPAVAHSWVERMMIISPDGKFTGQPGYARNNTMRTAPGFSDPIMVHILPGEGQPAIQQRQTPAKSDTQGISPSDAMCKKTQQTQFQTNGSPRLKAAAGDMVALLYEENGHVSLPDTQKGKPANRGNVSIYGTTQPKENEKFLDIFGVWNADGSGGDKRGKLLATQPFDDGRCHQTNGGKISVDRQQQFPHPASQLYGTDLWCQNDILIPKDAPNGKPYTLYWVWNWPTVPGVDPGLPKGKAEIYTSCMDVDITSTKASRDLETRQAPAGSGTDLNSMAIPAYVKALAAAPPAQPAPAQPAQAAASSPAAASPQKSAPAAASSPAAAPSAQAPSAQAPPAQAPSAQAPPAQAPPAQAPPAQAPPAQPSPPVASPPAAAAPAASPPARQVAPVAAQSVITVTVTAQPAQSAPPAPQAPPAGGQPSAQSKPAAVPPPAQASPAASSLPASLDLAPPVLGGASSGLPTFAGTATAITPAGAPTTMMTSTAPKNTAAPAIAPRGCDKRDSCKKAKRSRILGNAN